MAAFDEVVYVVLTAGSLDVLVEVVVKDDEHLLDLLNHKIRTIEGVRDTETFMYLRIHKETYAWGAPVSIDPDTLQADARRHLWMHFTRLGALEHHDVPIFTRGTGARLFDIHGRSYLDGLASLFVVQAGHGRADLAEAGRRQAEELAYYPIWSAAHPAAVALATRLARLAPGDLNRVFFTTGGSEAVESAWKLARAYFKAVGQPERTKVIAR